MIQHFSKTHFTAVLNESALRYSKMKTSDFLHLNLSRLTKYTWVSWKMCVNFSQNFSFKQIPEKNWNNNKQWSWWKGKIPFQYRLDSVLNDIIWMSKWYILKLEKISRVYLLGWSGWSLNTAQHSGWRPRTLRALMRQLCRVMPGRTLTWKNPKAHQIRQARHKG